MMEHAGVQLFISQWRKAPPPTGAPSHAEGEDRCTQSVSSHTSETEECHQQHACKGFVRVKAHCLQLEARCSSAPRVPAPSSLQSDPWHHSSWGSWTSRSHMSSRPHTISRRLAGGEGLHQPGCTAQLRQEAEDGLTHHKKRVSRGSTCNTRLSHLCYLFVLFSSCT